ncbi:hypothetical protein GCM10010390_43600 [Streptomyces mordarskii]|uniref:Uncharacterized protein n=1 Tax=Streptomyces mordarskii TaxID=1226758 RepID=A0ABN1D933_9ACTN
MLLVVPHEGGHAVAAAHSEAVQGMRHTCGVPACFGEGGGPRAVRARRDDPRVPMDAGTVFQKSANLEPDSLHGAVHCVSPIGLGLAQGVGPVITGAGA